MRNLLLILATLSWAGDAMSRPTILYENTLETADLSASSTAAGYSVDSVKTRIPSDRWTSNAGGSHTITAHLGTARVPSAFAITGHDGLLGTGDIELITDNFNRADETPLGSPWTRHLEHLNLASNLVTSAGQGYESNTAYTHNFLGLDTDGTGYAQVKVRFSDVSDDPAFHNAGVLLAWSDTEIALYVTLSAGGVLQAFTGASSLTGTESLTVVANTWYTLRVELTADGHLLAYVDGALKHTWTDAAILTILGASRKAGITTALNDSAVCVIDFDDFGCGILGDGETDRGAIMLRGGDDGTTWPYERTFLIDTSATILEPFDDATSREWWQWEFALDASRAITIGCLALGRRLDLTESMAQGFDPNAYKLVSYQARSNTGSYLGHTVRYPSQAAALKFGPAGLSTIDFFNVRGTPSWRDFIGTNWSIGRAFWFGWDLTQQPQDAWFCMVPANATTGAPFITAIRRGWTFVFDVLVEGLPR